MAARVVVVGGGVLGTMHAWEALQRGFEVVQLEREDGPRGASVRNFGLIWVSGRARGAELALALRARERWERIAADCPGIGFRANGSLTVAVRQPELAVLAEAAERPDAAERRLRLLDPDEARRVNPALAGSFLGALHCGADAAVEPRLVLGALREACQKTDRYRWLPGREVVGVADHQVTDDRGGVHDADLVVLCLGAWHRGVAAELVSGAPLRRVRLQMFETEPFAGPVTTSLADGDSLRYYPAFEGGALGGLAPQTPAAAEWAAQLLLVQRLHGGLTIGDTHTYDEPFPFDLEEAPTGHLLGVAGSLLGAIPGIARRWAGIYSQVVPAAGESQVVTAGEAVGPIYHRAEVAAGVQLVTGPGGRGMTLSPAIAEETFR